LGAAKAAKGAKDAKVADEVETPDASGQMPDADAPADDAEQVVIGGQRIMIQRYKGLGEMNPEQLWETTMDPQTRIMKQVNIEDAAKADEVFDILMGSDVAPRKRFIQTHAKTVQNLDV